MIKGRMGLIEVRLMPALLVLASALRLHRLELALQHEAKATTASPKRTNRVHVAPHMALGHQTHTQGAHDLQRESQANPIDHQPPPARTAFYPLRLLLHPIRSEGEPFPPRRLSSVARRLALECPYVRWQTAPATTGAAAAAAMGRANVRPSCRSCSRWSPSFPVTRPRRPARCASMWATGDRSTECARPETWDQPTDR